MGQTSTVVHTYTINMAKLLLLFVIFSIVTPFIFATFGGYGKGGGGYGGGHGGGTACIVKGSYCQCHYCKCEKGHVVAKDMAKSMEDMARVIAMEVLKENTVTVITVNVSMALEKRATRVDVGDITNSG